MNLSAGCSVGDPCSASAPSATHGDKLSELGTLPSFTTAFGQTQGQTIKGQSTVEVTYISYLGVAVTTISGRNILRKGGSLGSWLQMSVCTDSHVLPGPMHWREAESQQDCLRRTAGDIGVHQEVVRMGLNKGPFISFQSSVLRVHEFLCQSHPSKGIVVR